MFETVAGMRSRRIAFNAESVDVTNADSAGRWRELLAGAGGGRLLGPASSRTRRRSERAELFFDGLIRNWQVVIPDFGTVSGPFQVSGLEYAGQHDGEVSELALESAGALAFAAL